MHKFFFPTISRCSNVDYILRSEKKGAFIQKKENVRGIKASKQHGDYFSINSVPKNKANKKKERK